MFGVLLKALNQRGTFQDGVLQPDQVILLDFFTYKENCDSFVIIWFFYFHWPLARLRFLFIVCRVSKHRKATNTTEWVQYIVILGECTRREWCLKCDFRGEWMNERERTRFHSRNRVRCPTINNNHFWVNTVSSKIDMSSRVELLLHSYSISAGRER